MMMIAEYLGPHRSFAESVQQNLTVVLIREVEVVLCWKVGSIFYLIARGEVVVFDACKNDTVRPVRLP